jgi:hypothetical protein
MRFKPLLPTILLVLFAQLPVSAQRVYFNQSIDATPKAGQSIPQGVWAVTGQAGILVGDFRWGGVSNIRMLPQSFLTLRQYGFRASGGRYSEFFVQGKAYFKVRKSNPNTRVKICFKGNWKEGCSFLNSDVKVENKDSGEVLIGVNEGSVTLFDAEEKLTSVGMKQGEYSFLQKDGFTPPQTVYGVKGYYLSYKRSKTIGVFRAYNGWLFDNGLDIAQGHVDTPWVMRSPLDDGV